MKTNALLALTLAASALMSSAQQPRVTNTQFHSGPLSLGLSATVDRFRHSNSPLWLGYAVQALPRTHLSACSSWTGSSEVEDGCCNELRLEDTADNINTAAPPDAPPPTVYVLLRLDKGEVSRTRMARAGCTLNAKPRRKASDPSSPCNTRTREEFFVGQTTSRPSDNRMLALSRSASKRPASAATAAT